MKDTEALQLGLREGLEGVVPSRLERERVVLQQEQRTPVNITEQIAGLRGYGRRPHLTLLYATKWQNQSLEYFILVVRKMRFAHF